MTNILEKIIEEKKQSLILTKKEKSFDVLEKNIKELKSLIKTNETLISRAEKNDKQKISLLNSIHLLKAMYINNRASFYLIGVHPEYQNKGITAIIFNEMQKLFNKKNETNPCLLSPGDSVKFKSISKKEFEKLDNE